MSYQSNSINIFKHSMPASVHYMDLLHMLLVSVSCMIFNVFEDIVNLNPSSHHWIFQKLPLHASLNQMIVPIQQNTVNDCKPAAGSSLHNHTHPLHDHHHFEGKLPMQPKNFLTKPCIMDILQGQSYLWCDPTEHIQFLILPDDGSRVNFQNTVILTKVIW
jgi:hypothetical protein